MTLFGFRYPAVIVLTFTVAGTLVGYAIDFGPAALAAGTIAAGMALLLALFRVRGRYFIFPLAGFVMMLAAANAGLKYHVHSDRDIGHFLDAETELRFFASVDKWPTLKRHKTVLTCRVDSVECENGVYRCSGLMQLIIRQETTHFAFGDRISFSGRLLRPFAGPYPDKFAYERYLQHQGIRGIVVLDDATRVLVHEGGRNFLWRAINVARLWILDCFRDNLTEIPSALASGFLIGQTKDIPDRIYVAFRRTGTMHLLAVSGSNVALVLAAAYFAMRFIGLRRSARAMILIAITIVFSHLSYNQPSVVRASIMAALVIGARLSYRRMELNNIIAAAATVLILIDPANLFDIGFQLSFAVTWGLILFLPHLNHILKQIRSPRFIDYILLIVFSSVIATLISAPITAYYFGEASLVTVVSNLAVVPMVSAAVIGSIILLAVEASLPGAAVVIGAVLDLLLRWIYAVVLWFGQWDFAETQMSSFPAAYVFLVLAAVAALFFAPRFRSARVALVGLLVLAGTGVFIDKVLMPSAKPAEIEIFNSGSVQTAIINSGGGVVVYRQTRDTRQDEFCEGLLPYLIGREATLPEFFVFLEPRYRTERHLAEAAEVFSQLSFRPMSSSYPEKKVSVWRASRNGDVSGISAPSIRYNDGTLIVHPPDGRRFVFMTEIPAHLDSSADPPGKAEYLIVSLDDITELDLLLKEYRHHQLIVVIDEPCRDVIRSPVADRFERNGHLVCKSERFELPVESTAP